MTLSILRNLLPDRPLPLPIVSGPFRGATIYLKPRYSLRKVFGLYEHEMNEWLNQVLPQISIVLDVGAYDGYFTFGCQTALQRLDQPARIIAFEPLPDFFADLKTTLEHNRQSPVAVDLHHCQVGAILEEGVTTLDAIAVEYSIPKASDRALIKIDVEGAELNVIAGAAHWLQPEHFFLIEIHDFSYLENLTRLFASRGIRLRQVNQQPLPILGREHRSELNWWLISDLS